MTESEPDILAVFSQAVEHASAEERSRYLDEACQGDPTTRQRVESLVQAHFKAGKFLGGKSVEPMETIDQPVGERPGVQIGPYKLREQIGAGGFGVVYVAEQEKPVARKVALKIIKPGMDTRAVVARFESERQALALMDHPHIAKVLDAGATESGRPYFVMELVRGTSLTEFCDAQNLQTNDRLRLFIDVCRAVQHAHQKGIIHRDLKPSNVMVTMRDDRAIPKVIDFGVAKALSRKLTEMTLYTGYGQLIGTPLYMSPEQAQMNDVDVDTRSDVYSLGVLLYELLTGVTPFDKETVRKAGFDDLRRIIREETPPRPSDRVSTLDAHQRSTVSVSRQSDADSLARSLRGELDWIVMKALEKDRDRRYESASAFAADIERYLNNEAVIACPPSASYRFRKFVRRNQVAIGTISAVVLALAVGVCGTTWQAVRATWAEQDALEQRDRAIGSEERAKRNLEQALTAVDGMLMRVADERLKNVPMVDHVRLGLHEDALRTYRRLSEQSPDDPRLRLYAAKAQRRAGLTLILLGRDDEAHRELKTAAAELGAIRELIPDSAAAEIELGYAHMNLGGIKSLALPVRRTHLEKAVEILRGHAASPDVDLEVQLDLGFCLSVLAGVHWRQGDRKAARNSVSEADRIFASLTETDPAHRKVAINHAKHLQNVGGQFLESGELQTAGARFGQAADLVRELALGQTHDAEGREVYAVALLNQGNVLMREQKLARAEALFAESIDVLRELCRDHSFPKHLLRLAGTLLTACWTAHQLGDAETGAARAEEAVSILEYLVENWPTREHHGVLGAALSNQALILSRQNMDLEQAEQLARRAIEEQRRSLESPEDVNTHLLKHYRVLAAIQMQRGQFSQADATCESGLQVAESLRQKQPDHPSVASIAHVLTMIQRDARKAEAQELVDEPKRNNAPPDQQE